MSALSFLGNLIIISIILFLLAGYFYINSIINNKSINKKPSIFRKLLKNLIPKKTSKEYKKAKLLLENSYINIDVSSFYYMKLICLIIGCIFCLIIFYTNTVVNQHKYLADNSVNISYAFNKNADTSLVEQNFYTLKKHLNINELKENDPVSNAKVSNVLLTYGNVDKNDVNSITAVLINSISKIKSLYSLNRILKYMGFAILVFFLPDLIIRVYSKIKKENIKDESARLLNLLSIVGSNANINTQNILNILVNNSYYLKKTMRSFQNSYLTNRENAYNDFFNDSKVKHVSRIIVLLRQIEKSDRRAALKSIVTTNKNSEKLRKLAYENKLEKKEGILLTIFSLGAFYLVKIIMDASVGVLPTLFNNNKF